MLLKLKENITTWGGDSYVDTKWDKLLEKDILKMC